MRFSATLAAVALAATLLLPTTSDAQSFEVSGTLLPTPPSTSQRGDEELLENFDKATASFLNYTFGAGGPPVFGPNTNYTVVGAGFESEGAREVVGADIYFSDLAASPSTATYDVLVFEGDSDTGPQGAPIGSQSFNFADAVSDGSATSVTFDTPIAITGDIFIVVDYAASGTNPDANIGATEDTETPGQPSWIFFNAAWSRVEALLNAGGNALEANLWIDARVAAPNTAVEGLPASVDAIRVFPNPMASQGAVELDLVETAEVRVSLHDALGREVAVLQDGALAAGRRTLAMDTPSLAAGVYLARVQVGDSVVARRFSVVR